MSDDIKKIPDSPDPEETPKAEDLKPDSVTSQNLEVAARVLKHLQLDDSWSVLAIVGKCSGSGGGGNGGCGGPGGDGGC